MRAVVGEPWWEKGLDRGRGTTAAPGGGTPQLVASLASTPGAADGGEPGVLAR